MVKTECLNVLVHNFLRYGVRNDLRIKKKLSQDTFIFVFHQVQYVNGPFFELHVAHIVAFQVTSDMLI